MSTEEETRDAQIIQGGPGEKVPFQDQDGQKEEKVQKERDDEVTQQLHNQINNLQNQLNNLQNNNAQLYNYITQKQVEPESKKSKDDYDELMYSDPNAFVKKLKQEIMNDVGDMREDVIDEIQHKSSADKLYSDFWDTFWKKNSDLDQSVDTLIVKSIFNENKDYWSKQNLTIKQAQDILADESRKIIANYSGGKRDAVAKGTYSEGAASNPINKQKNQDDQLFGSATDILKSIRKKKLG